MKIKVLLLLTAALLFTMVPLFSESMAQQVANPKGGSYKGVANFYSQRFFPVGQVTAPVDNKTVEANAADDAETETEATDTETTDVEVTETTDTTEEAVETDAQAIEATYDENAGTITYTDANGDEQTIDIADMGLSADWMNTLIGLGGTLSVTEEDGEVSLITGSDDSGAKKWEFDPSSRLVSHYTGEKGSEKVSVVTTDQEYNSNYLWSSDGTADPGAGPDGHFVAQRFNYKDSGALDTVDYFAWTGGNRGGLHPEVHAQIFGAELTKARYMYRRDTVYQTGSDDNSDVTAECADDNTKIVTKYFNDPFPEDWDPVYTGTVSKDEYGNYWLDAGCKKFLLVCGTDGFDADSDGQSGADEMNSVDWESLVGKEITVRGNEIASDSEAGIYSDGEKAEMFQVVDLITPEEKESLGDDYQATLDNMEAVASRVDPVHEGLIGSGEGPGALGVVNLFNGTIPTAGQLVEAQQLNRRMNSMAPIYTNNLTADDLAAVREFAIPELATALDAAEQAREQAAEAEDEEQNAQAQNNNAAQTQQRGGFAAVGGTTQTDTIEANEENTVDDLLNRQNTVGGFAAVN